MKQTLLILVTVTTFLVQAKASVPVKMEITDSDSYTNFQECKTSLENMVAVLMGHDDLSSVDVTKLKSEIRFTPLLQVSTRPGPETSAEGAQIYKLRGQLKLKDFYTGDFVIEAGHGYCEIQKMTITQ